jgi:hypothetical protein
MKTFWDCDSDERKANRAIFDQIYNDETVETHPFRCVDEFKGFYTRKDGNLCTQEDVDFAYLARALGQTTKFTLVDGKIEVYGWCDHGD